MIGYYICERQTYNCLTCCDLTHRTLTLDFMWTVWPITHTVWHCNLCTRCSSSHQISPTLPSVFCCCCRCHCLIHYALSFSSPTHPLLFSHHWSCFCNLPLYIGIGIIGIDEIATYCPHCFMERLFVCVCTWHTQTQVYRQSEKKCTCSSGSRWACACTCAHCGEGNTAWKHTHAAIASSWSELVCLLAVLNLAFSPAVKEERGGSRVRQESHRLSSERDHF